MYINIIEHTDLSNSSEYCFPKQTPSSTINLETFKQNLPKYLSRIPKPLPIVVSKLRAYFLFGIKP